SRAGPATTTPAPSPSCASCPSRAVSTGPTSPSPSRSSSRPETRHPVERDAEHVAPAAHRHDRLVVVHAVEVVGQHHVAEDGAGHHLPARTMSTEAPGG